MRNKPNIYFFFEKDFVYFRNIYRKNTTENFNLKHNKTKKAETLKKFFSIELFNCAFLPVRKKTMM